MTPVRHLALAIAVGAALIIPTEGPAAMNDPAAARQDHPYVGMWVTDDGHVRHNLLPNGRYDEARGDRESAYRGRYEVRGDHIDYWDDTGFTADGTFIDGVLHHGGMILRRRE
ncbi:Atu4866 domain-containing protein [Azospirillum halopraeferens]|uniref:Atu4866 domain-containing protein n=1 Tax=Azospirillum halopraeferens TaxID=34010 RepID=UPI000419FD80|nr:Atu4866 domain-containing protein [Azospirillum halopraeferens]